MPCDPSGPFHFPTQGVLFPSEGSLPSGQRSQTLAALASRERSALIRESGCSAGTGGWAHTCLPDPGFRGT